MAIVRILVILLAAQFASADQIDMRLVFIDAGTREPISGVTVEFSSDGVETLRRGSHPDGKCVLFGCPSSVMNVSASIAGYVTATWTGNCNDTEEWKTIELTPIRNVSLFELITDGEDYFGEAVLVCGFFAPRPPHGALLAPSETLLKHGSICDWIPVAMTDAELADYEEYGDHYRCLTGFFLEIEDSSGPKGYLSNKPPK